MLLFSKYNGFDVRIFDINGKSYTNGENPCWLHSAEKGMIYYLTVSFRSFKFPMSNCVKKTVPLKTGDMIIWDTEANDFYQQLKYLKDRC